MIVGMVLSVVLCQAPFTCVATRRLRRRRLIICRTESRIDFAAWLLALLADLIIAVSPPYSVLFAFVVTINTAAFTWVTRLAWYRRCEHRDHDEDCVYGPKQPRARAAARLTWRKVSLNPAFAPT